MRGRSAGRPGIAVAGRAFVTALLVGGAPAAQATLGEGRASIQSDPQRFMGSHRQAWSHGVEVHTQTLPDGSVVRQFVDAGGRVFAVAWNTRSKPRLDQLLGVYHATLVAAARSAQRERPGIRHSASVHSGDLVVEATAHLQSHVGRAYLRSWVPAGTPLDALR